VSARVAIRLDESGVVRRIDHDPDGVLPADLLGQPLRDALGTQDGPRLHQLLGEAVDHGVSSEQSVEVRGADGAPTPVRLTATRIDGELLVLGRSPDEVPPVAVLDEFTAVNNELVAMQRQLARSNARLRVLSEEKSQLLGMAAHDLRNPLAAIAGYAAFLFEEPSLPDEARSFVASIRDRSTFMARLVDDLLDVSELESGAVRLRRAAVDGFGFAEEVVAREAVAGSRKDIALHLEQAGVRGVIFADASKLEQVLVNLVGNAIKYSPRGSAVIVRLTGTDEALRLEIIDQGQGIPEREQIALFRPFWKTSVRGTEGEQSTGLGLAIVARLVEAHGGSIVVRSTVGQGTTFDVRLPRNLPAGP